MNTKVILDSSALLALIQNEKGADVIKPLIKGAIMSSINIAEVMTALLRVDILPKEACASITDIIHEVVPFDLGQAQMVAELYQHVMHKGLSLGDRACISLGQKLDLPIYTADKIWGDLNLENTTIMLIR